MFFLITVRLLEARMPVIECGYRNSASAEPSARVAYWSWLVGPSSVEPNGLPVVGLVLASAVDAWSKMWPQPPSLAGR
jgi:hypothetical protein